MVSVTKEKEGAIKFREIAPLEERGVGQLPLTKEMVKTVCELLAPIGEKSPAIMDILKHPEKYNFRTV
ncbi:hypothetical protein AUJ17_03350 [Candidatus Micrarchaeota archaeon CG1_02_47_40]|nr:MAG: hypothetical protein AUJ17_03350 [Candidatus Micrarchaeota archaeon CG1_02_47_40]